MLKFRRSPSRFGRHDQEGQTLFGRIARLDYGFPYERYLPGCTSSTVSKIFREVVNFPQLSIHLYSTLLLPFICKRLLSPREMTAFITCRFLHSGVLQPLPDGSSDRSIIVLTIVGILDGVISKASEVIIRQGMGIRLALQEARHGAHPICSVTASSTTNIR